MRGERVVSGKEAKAVEREDRRSTITHRFPTPPTQPSPSTQLVHRAENLGIDQARSLGKYIGVAKYFKVLTMQKLTPHNVPHHTPYELATIAYKVETTTNSCTPESHGYVTLRALSVG